MKTSGSKIDDIVWPETRAIKSKRCAASWLERLQFPARSFKLIHRPHHPALVAGTVTRACAQARGRILQKAADILRRDSDAYAKLLTLEMGKLFAEAKAEVELSAKIFEYYVRHAGDLLKPEKLPVLEPGRG